MRRAPLLSTLLLGTVSLAGAPLTLAQLSDTAAPAPAAPAAPVSPAALTPPPELPPLRSAPAPAAVAPLVPAAPVPAARPAPASSPPPVTAGAPSPLRPSFDQIPEKQPRRFDQSLDELVRQGVVSPGERARIQSAGALQPTQVPAHREACRSGALSEQECRTGVSVMWRGRGDGALAGEPGGGLPGSSLPGLNGGLGGLARLGPDGVPLPPLTVPVSALLAGAGGNFSLSSVFRVSPRPAAIAGNGNRGLLFPLIGSAVTTSNFGWRLHPVLGSWLMHAGRDLAAPEGTPVVAALAGRVVSSGLAGGYGLAIEIEHQRPLRRTLYGHLSELYVKEGEWVPQGVVIGRVGSTGLSTGPHLHFELRQPENGGWVAMDPGEFDPGRQPGLSGPAGSDAIALLMGQLLQTLERPAKGA